MKHHGGMGGLGGVSPDVVVLLARMGLALALGTLLAWRPLSRLFGGTPSRGPVAAALVLMTVAAMFAMLIIGDSVARAFGVVGLGSFVRFRTSIKSPADAVLFFIAIGVGMACALGVYEHAAIVVAALSLILIPIDRAAAKAEPKESLSSKPEKAISTGGSLLRAPVAPGGLAE